MATRVEALRVLRAVKLVNATHKATLGETGEPILIDNYITAAGTACFAIKWNEGPKNWAREFAQRRDEYLESITEQHSEYVVVNTIAYAAVRADGPDTLAIL